MASTSKRGGAWGRHFRVNFLPEVGIVERIAGVERSAGVGVPQNDLGPPAPSKSADL